MKITTEIIQEALEATYHSMPKTWGDRLFYRDVSESKLKSAAIVYLTNRVMKAEENGRQAEQKMYQGITECLRVIERTDPKQMLHLKQKFL